MAGRFDVPDDMLDAPPSAFVDPSADGSGSDPAVRALVRKRNGLNPLFTVTPALAQAFDAYSTRQALQNENAREGNPVMAHSAGRDALLYGEKLAVGAALGFLADRLARAGHPTAGKILSAVSVGAPVAAGIHNLEIAGRK